MGPCPASRLPLVSDRHVAGCRLKRPEPRPVCPPWPVVRRRVAAGPPADGCLLALLGGDPLLLLDALLFGCQALGLQTALALLLGLDLGRRSRSARSRRSFSSC